MPILDGNVTDQNGVIVSGALVYIYDADGDLAELTDDLDQELVNPVTTGEDGYWSAYVAEEGYYTAQYFWGGRKRRIDANLIAGRSPLERVEYFSDLAAAYALALQIASSGGFYDSLAAGAADPAVEEGEAYIYIIDGRMFIGQKIGGVGVSIVEFSTVAALLSGFTSNKITMPVTTGADVGVIYKDADRFIHNYGGSNLFGGVRSGNFTLTSTTTVALGFMAGNSLSTAELSTLVGWHAGKAITTGGVCTLVGAEAGANVTTGSYLDGFGCKALANATTLMRTKAFGQSCFMKLETGSDNTGGGQEAGIELLHATYVTIWGASALNAAVGTPEAPIIDVTAIGGLSQYNTVVSGNTTLGKATLFKNTTGVNHAVGGLEAGYENITGSGHSLWGVAAGRANVDGDEMTAVGLRAGYGSGGDDASVSDDNMTFVGAFAARSIAVPAATILQNSTAIGHSAKVTKSNQVTLGNGDVDEFVVAGVTFSKAELEAIKLLVA